MVADPEQPEPYYSEARIRWWLKHWPLLESLAQSPHTSGHHLGHSEDDDRPCMPSPSGGPHMRGQRRDPLFYADVQADLERAHAHLRYQSIEWVAIDYLIRFGPLGMRQLREMMAKDMNAVTEAYRSAVEQMAKYLSE